MLAQLVSSKTAEQQNSKTDQGQNSLLSTLWPGLGLVKAGGYL